MKKFLLFFPFLLLFLNACKKVNGDGPVVTENRSTGDFTGIHFELPGTLYYESGAEPGIEITAQRNIINVIETYVSNDELKIRLKDHTVIHSHESIEVRVKSPQIGSLHLSGSGAMKLLQPVSASRLWVESSGSGDVEIGHLTATELETRISGSGRISVVNGSADKVKFKISGSGKVEASGLEARQGFTETSGSGDIRLWVTEYLESRISGSGNVWYKGNPQVKVDVSGSGKVSPMN